MNLLDTTIPAHYLGLPARQIGYVPERLRTKAEPKPADKPKAKKGQSGIKRGPYSRLTEEQYLKIVNMRSEGAKLADIATAVRISRDQVSHALSPRKRVKFVVYMPCVVCGTKKIVAPSRREVFKFCSNECRYKVENE